MTEADVTIKMDKHPDAYRTDLPEGAAMMERAKVFAYGAHGGIGQRRKYTGEHYIVHPKAVAAIVASVEHTPAMIAAAWLHDVIEDTKVVPELLMGMFGHEVSELVWWLTDPPLAAGNRKKRNEMTHQRLSRAPAQAHTIKLADMIDNSLTIAEHDPDFWRVYRNEMANKLDVLRLGDVGLWNRAAEQLGVEERR